MIEPKISGKSYGVYNTDEFTTFLDPTPVTLRVSEWVDSRATNRLDALRLAAGAVKHLIKYTSDLKGYGHEEYFASPTEALTKHIGDCDEKAFTVAAVLNGLTKYKPKNVYVTIGVYTMPMFLYKKSSYHAWGYADGYIVDGTAGWAIHSNSNIGERYKPVLGVMRHKIVMMLPTSKVISEDIELAPLVASMAAPVLAGAAGGAVSGAMNALNKERK